MRFEIRGVSDGVDTGELISVYMLVRCEVWVYSGCVGSGDEASV